MFLLDRGEIECRTIGRIDVAAVEQDVAAFDQRGQARCRVWIFPIERDARFIEIEERETGALTFRRQRRRAAQRITVGRLDFQDGRAEIGEQTRAVARRSGAPDLDDS